MNTFFQMAHSKEMDHFVLPPCIIYTVTGFLRSFQTKLINKSAVMFIDTIHLLQASRLNFIYVAVNVRCVASVDIYEEVFQFYVAGGKSQPWTLGQKSL